MLGGVDVGGVEVGVVVGVVGVLGVVVVVAGEQAAITSDSAIKQLTIVNKILLLIFLPFFVCFMFLETWVSTRFSGKSNYTTDSRKRLSLGYKRS